MKKAGPKVLAILGSPRRNGNTAHVLGWVLEHLGASGCLVERLDITDYDLVGCVGCHLCQKEPGKLFCSRKDRGLEVLRKMIEADAVIYATPLYWWDFTAQMKLLVDRQFCLVHGADSPATHRSLIEGKPLALLVTAYDHEGPGNTDLLSETFRRMATYCKAEVRAELVVPFCRSPLDLGPIQRERAREFSERLLTRSA